MLAFFKLDCSYFLNFGDAMLNSTYLDSLTQKLIAVLPVNLQQVEQDIQHNFKALLQSAFNQLDLVSREEFDVQTKVLARTRAKVDALYEEINALQTLKKK